MPRFFWPAILLGLTVVPSARAGLTISLTPEANTIAPGGTVAVDVSISMQDGSPIPPGSPIPLNSYDLFFNLSRNGSLPVSFVSPPDPASSAINDTNYVFYTNSGDGGNDPGTIAGTPPGSLIELTDFTNDGTDYPLNSSSLVTRFFIQANSGTLSPGDSETITVSLTNPELDSYASAYTIDNPSQTLTLSLTNPSTPVATPEPATLLMIVSGLGSASLVHRLRIRSRAKGV